MQGDAARRIFGRCIDPLVRFDVCDRRVPGPDHRYERSGDALEWAVAMTRYAALDFAATWKLRQKLKITKEGNFSHSTLARTPKKVARRAGNGYEPTRCRLCRMEDKQWSIQRSTLSNCWPT